MQYKAFNVCSTNVVTHLLTPCLSLLSSLVFSQSLLSLDLIELFLSYKDEELAKLSPKKVRRRVRVAHKAA